jgi:hypothetical protein
MTILLKIFLFLTGVSLSVQLVASLYRIIDLWYTINNAYPRVLRGIMGWSALTVLIAMLSGAVYRPAFLWGLFSFLLFHIVSYWTTKLLFRLSASKGFE